MFEDFIVSFNLIGEEGGQSNNFTSHQFAEYVQSLTGKSVNLKNVFNFITRLAMGGFVTKNKIEKPPKRGPRVMYTKVCYVKPDDTWIFHSSYTSVCHRLGLEKRKTIKSEVASPLTIAIYEKFKKQYMEKVDEHLVQKKEVERLKTLTAELMDENKRLNTEVRVLKDHETYDWSFLDSE